MSEPLSLWSIGVHSNLEFLAGRPHLECYVSPDDFAWLRLNAILAADSGLVHLRSDANIILLTSARGGIYIRPRGDVGANEIRWPKRPLDLLIEAYGLTASFHANHELAPGEGNDLIRRAEELLKK